MTSRAAQYARQLAQAVREQLHGASYFAQGRRRASNRCPDWCSTDRCTLRLGFVRGEHRSEPLVWRTPYGTLITTLVETAARHGSIEIRADVRLGEQARVARTQAQHLAVGVDLTIRAVLADIAQTTASGPPQLPGRAPDALDRWLAGITDEVTGGQLTAGGDGTRPPEQRRPEQRRPELPPGALPPEPPPGPARGELPGPARGQRSPSPEA